MTPDEMREYKKRCVEARKARQTILLDQLQQNQRAIVAQYEERQRQHGKPPTIPTTLQRYWGRRGKVR